MLRYVTPPNRRHAAARRRPALILDVYAYVYVYVWHEPNGNGFWNGGWDGVWDAWDGVRNEYVSGDGRNESGRRRYGYEKGRRDAVDL